MDRFKAMQTFVEIVNTGSFSGAAKKLGLSRSVVSKQVQQLEHHLGATLFNRTTRRMSLTEIGDDYFAFSSKLLGDLKEEEAAISHLHRQPRGVLKLAAPHSLGSMVIAPIIAEFAIKYPDITIYMLPHNQFKYHPVELIDSGFDLAVCIAPNLADSSVVGRKLGEIEWFVCASPGYLRKNGTPRTPRDLKDHNCLMLMPRSEGPDAEWHFTGQDGSEAVVVTGSLVSTMDSVKVATAAGVGIAMLPLYSIRDELGDGRIVRLLTDYKIARRNIYCLSSYKGRAPRKVQVFSDFLASRLKSAGYAGPVRSPSPSDFELVEARSIRPRRS